MTKAQRQRWGSGAAPTPLAAFARKALSVTILAFAWTAIFAGTASADTRTVYDTFQKKGGYTLSDYYGKWENGPGGAYGLGDMGVSPGDTRSFAGGTFYIDDAPFRTSYDFSVFDHLKYIATSKQSFAVPARGSVMFSSEITASTPGTVPGRVVHGTYGPPGSYPNGGPYSATVLQGQQAGAVMNMVDFCTGQLFDWFVAGNTAFPLIERLPTSVTQNTSNPACAGNYAGPNEMYTQIIKEVPIAAGVTHRVGIRYTRTPKTSYVEYFLDGKLVAKSTNIGVPLDVQGVTYTGISPSIPGATGEDLRTKINSFSIGHGTFSLLDAFPYQWGWFDVCPGASLSPLEAAACGLSVSIPTSERLFGQGVRAHFDNFTVTTSTG
jgi:hypothetical protein